MVSDKMKISLPSNISKAVAKYHDDGLKGLFHAIYNHAKIKVGGRVRPRLEFIYRRWKYGSAAPRACDLITVNPDEIDYLVSPNFRSWFPVAGTHIATGNWDKRYAQNEQSQDSESKFIDKNGKMPKLYEIDKTLTQYKLAQKLFVQKKGKNEITEINMHESRLEREIEQLEYIRDSIIRQGYRTQQELKKQDRKATGSLQPEYDEIRVNIGRSGEILFDDGRHRFAIAKIMELDKIPVRVFVRHKKWQQIRHMVASGKFQEVPDDINLSHPDIQNIILFE